MKKANGFIVKEANQAVSKTAVINKVLLEEGYRLTPQRQAVMDILLRYSDRYLEGDAIYGFVKQAYPSVGIATIYRTLTLFERLNLVSVIPTGDRGNRYRLQLESGGKRLLICRKCGQTLEFFESPVWLDQFLEKNDFWAEEVIIYGTCGQCCRKN
jgi:Fe2+/Zn2+ uptake regulation proteins